VLEENEAARRFYERRGWRADGASAKTTRYPVDREGVRYAKELGYVKELRSTA
jgi:hypothetical protein